MTSIEIVARNIARDIAQVELDYTCATLRATISIMEFQRVTHLIETITRNIV